MDNSQHYLIYHYHNQTVTVDPRVYLVGTISEGDFSLLLLSVTVQCSGTYMCRLGPAPGYPDIHQSHTQVTVVERSGTYFILNDNNWIAKQALKTIICKKNNSMCICWKRSWAIQIRLTDYLSSLHLDFPGQHRSFPGDFHKPDVTHPDWLLPLCCGLFSLCLVGGVTVGIWVCRRRSPRQQNDQWWDYAERDQQVDMRERRRQGESRVKKHVQDMPILEAEKNRTNILETWNAILKPMKATFFGMFFQSHPGERNTWRRHTGSQWKQGNCS